MIGLLLAAVVTQAPDCAGGTQAPDCAGGTQAPDCAGGTQAPDCAGGTQAPDRAGAGARLTTTHTYVEGRVSLLGAGAAARTVGGALEGSAGVAFRWLDVGMTARGSSFPRASSGHGTSSFGFGPELGLRKSLGEGATFRVAVAPMYAIAWDDAGAFRRIGADALAQLLFTLDERGRPAWRAGLGLRAGRWTAVDTRAPGWSLGVDLLVRSWW